MATTTNDLLSAIDAYMLTKGKGMGYLASKVGEIFDDKDAPLNAKTGPLRIVSEMFDDLQVKVKALHIGATSPLAVFKKETTWLNKSLKSFNKKIGTVIDSLNLVDAFLKSIMTISKPSGTGPSGMPYKLTSDGLLKVSLWGMLPKYSLAGIPVYIKNISDHVVDKFLRNSTREKVLSSPIPIETADKKPNQINNTTINTQNNKDDSEKGGGWLSSILGIGAGLLGIGWLNTELDKTEAGQQVKSHIKIFISTLFDKIGEWITTDGKDYMISAVKGLWGGLKWLGKDIYNKIIKGNYAAAIAESLFSWAVLRKLPISGWIIRPMEKLLKSGVGKIFSGLGGAFKGLGSKVWGPLSKVGGTLAKLAGKAFIIYGIYEGIMSIWDSGTKIFNIIQDINKTSKDALESAQNTKKGWDAKNQTRNAKLQKEIDSLEQKELNGTITLAEQLQKNQLKIKQKINADDAALEKIANVQAERVSGPLGFLYAQTTAFEKQAEDELRSAKESAYKEIKDLDNKIKNLKNGSMTQSQVTDNAAQKLADEIMGIKAIPVHDATVIQPHSKDQILMAKSGGPFDLAMKQMNNLMRDKLDMLIDIMTANVHATVEGSSAVVKTVAATSGKGGGSIGGFNNFTHDPIRSMRNQVNHSIR